MKLVRPMRGIVAIGSLLLLAIIAATVVAATRALVPSLMILGVVIAAIVTGRIAGRRVRLNTVLELDLDQGVVERPPISPLDRALNGKAQVLRDVIDGLDRAGDDKRVVGVVARVGNGKLGVARAQEIRDAVHRFRESGKKAVAFAESFGEGASATVDYYVAAAFDEIHILPTGSVGVEGLVSSVPFLGRFFEKFGVTPDLDHREEYKAAKYRLTETEFLDPHREAVTAILDGQLDQIVEGISADRSLTQEAVRGAIDNAPLTAEEALDAKLVDSISFRDQAYAEAKSDKGHLLFLDRYIKRAGRPHRRGKTIALVYGTGAIQRGKSGLDPLSRGSSMGADDVARSLREAADDRKVKAIVFRVDSPGGSAVASDLIGREVTRAREAGKPVVVSMGDVAGSGGYWIAAPASWIVAQPGTITGSIGVVSGKLARAGMWDRIGVDVKEIHVGRNATTWAPIAPFSESERERNEAFLDAIYSRFLAHVGEGRGMETAKVREVAKGRIWSGASATENGLVDQLGGLGTAIEKARMLAGLEQERMRIRLFPRQRTLPIPERKDNSEPISMLVGALYGLVDSTTGAGQPGVELRMPRM